MCLKSISVESLKDILKFAGDIKLKNLMEEIQKRVENKDETPLTPYLKKNGWDTSSGIGAVLSSGVSLSTHWSLFNKARSKMGILGFYHLYNGDFEKCGEEFKKIYVAQKTLMEYLTNFSPEPEQPFNVNSFLYSIVLDSHLYKYLKDNQVSAQLADLIGSLNIPKFDAKKAEKSIQFFTNLHETVYPLAQHHHLNDWDSIYAHLIDNIKVYNDTFLLASDLIKDLKELIKVFTIANTFPIEQLLNPYQELKKPYPCGRDYYDCKTLFEKYVDLISLGKIYGSLVTTRVQSIINSRNLDNFFFISNSTSILDCPLEKTIFTNFNGCALEVFSFKNTFFVNTHFKDVYFYDCDFSKAAFIGKIFFENVYMDGKTAQTFLNRLFESLFVGEYGLKIAGLDQINLYNHQEDELNLIKKIASQIKFDLKTASPHPTKIEHPSIPENIEQIKEEARSWHTHLGTSLYNIGSSSYNLVSTGIGMAVDPFGSAKKIQETIQNTYTYYSNWDSKEPQKSDISKLSDLKPEIQNLKTQLEEGLAQFKVNLGEITNSFSKEFREQEEKIKGHEEILEKINHSLEQINGIKDAKEAILSEQRRLLENTHPQIRAYYQTLLTSLCTLLNSLALLNNDHLNLIKSAQGSATKLSRKAEKRSSNQDIIKSIINGLKNFSESILEPADLIAPILQPLTELPEFFPGAVSKLVQISDSHKIAKTKELYRGLTPKKLEKIADAIARKISISYQQQICLLSIDGAIRFAENAAQCIAAALLNDLIFDKTDFVNYAWSSIRNLKHVHNKSLPFINISLPGTTETLQGKEPNTRFTANALYRHSVISYYDEKNGWIEYPEKHTNENKYRHFFILKEELKYFVERAETAPTLKTSIPSLNDHEVKPLGAGCSAHINHYLIEKLNEATRRQEETNHKLKLLQQESDLNAKMIQNLGVLFQDVIQGKTVTLADIDSAIKVHDQTTSKKTMASQTPAPSNKFTPISTLASSPLGFLNLGQSCYISAALQVIKTIPSLCQIIHDITNPVHASYQKDNKIAHALLPLLTGNKKIDIENLREAIFDLSLFKDDGFKNYKLDSKRIYNEKKSKDSKMDSYVERSYENYKNSQLDAQEVLVAIFDQLKWMPYEMAEYASVPGVLPEELEKNVANIMSVQIPTTKLFLKYLKAKYVTEERLEKFLKTRYNTKEDFEKYINSKKTDDVPPSISMTFQDVLDVHFFGEKMQLPRIIGNTSVNQWNKSPKVIGHPNHIIIQLGRFNSDGNKIQASINFLNNSAEIECSTSKKEYQIIAFMNHNGSNLNSGHYVSFIKNSNEWYLCDDSEVLMAPPESILKHNHYTYITSQDSYIIVLNKKC